MTEGVYNNEYTNKQLANVSVNSGEVDQQPAGHVAAASTIADPLLTTQDSSEEGLQSHQAEERDQSVGSQYTKVLVSSIMRAEERANTHHTKIVARAYECVREEAQRRARGEASSEDHQDVVVLQQELGEALKYFMAKEAREKQVMAKTRNSGAQKPHGQHGDANETREGQGGT